MRGADRSGTSLYFSLPPTSWLQKGSRALIIWRPSALASYNSFDGAACTSLATRTLAPVVHRFPRAYRVLDLVLAGRIEDLFLQRTKYVGDLSKRLANIATSLIFMHLGVCAPRLWPTRSQND